MSKFRPFICYYAFSPYSGSFAPLLFQTALAIRQQKQTLPDRQADRQARRANKRTLLVCIRDRASRASSGCHCHTIMSWTFTNSASSSGLI